MLLLTAQPQQGDPIALAMVAVLLLLLTIAVLRKRFGHKKPVAQPTVATPSSVQNESLAPGSAGQLKLHDVDPKTAAMLMAIVADKMEKPLNELRFISIKEVK